MMAMLPLMLIAIIVIALAILTARTMNRHGNRKGKYSYSRRVRLLFSGYMAVLLICVVLDTVHPVNTVEGWKKVDTEELDKESNDLYDAALAGEIAHVDSKFLREKWSFDYNGPQLDVAWVEDDYVNISVFVERKKSNDGKIEAVFYQTRSSVNGMEITDYTNPPSLEMAKDELFLRNPKISKFEFAEFTNVFSVKQFTGENFFSHHSEFSGDQSILYMRIPKDLELNDKTGINLNYVE